MTYRHAGPVLAQWTKMLAPKLDNLSFISGSHMVDRELTPRICILTSM